MTNFVSGLTFAVNVNLKLSIGQHTPYQRFTVTGYIVNRWIDRTGTDVKQTEVDCELTNGALSSRY
jgi:hypothetical protein